ncbi:MAG: thioredoxin family protein [Pseudomonadota bacterium]
MTVLISHLDQMQAFVREEPAAAVYFAGEGCNVCTVLYPKVEALLQQEFPRVALARVECGTHSEICAQHGVFSIPTLLLFFDGHESQRYVRNIGLGELRQALERPYQLLFGADA